MFNNYDMPEKDYGNSDKELIKSQDARNIIDILLNQEKLGVKLTNEQKERFGYFLTRYAVTTLTYFESDLEDHDKDIQESLNRPGVDKTSARIRQLARVQESNKEIQNLYKESN